jgi:hypothetical protein
MRLLKVYFNSRMIAEPVGVMETKHGFHLRIPKRTSLWRQIEVRLMLSDCKGRLAFDEMKIDMGLIELYDTLFEFKKGKDDKWYSEEPFNVLSEPFWYVRGKLMRGKIGRRWSRRQKRMLRGNRGERNGAMSLLRLNRNHRQWVLYRHVHQESAPIEMQEMQKDVD